MVRLATIVVFALVAVLAGNLGEASHKLAHHAHGFGCSGCAHHGPAPAAPTCNVDADHHCGHAEPDAQDTDGREPGQPSRPADPAHDCDVCTLLACTSAVEVPAAPARIVLEPPAPGPSAAPHVVASVAAPDAVRGRGPPTLRS